MPSVYAPLVSVIIPAWNEEKSIGATMRSVLANSYENIEIIVVNDGSTDSTLQRIEKLKKIYDAKPLPGKMIKIINQKQNQGKGEALNAGIKKASGEIVVTMDADSAHHKDAVKNIVKYFRDPEIDALVGNVKIANNNTIIGLTQKLEYLFGFYFKRVHSIFNAEYIFGGACAAFRKSATFDKIGYFDTVNKTEDIEYSMRVKLHGLKCIYAEDVIAYTEGANNFRGLYSQRLRWKKGRFDTFLKYKSLFFSLNKNHSRFLTWFVLPFALLGEAQMFLEPLFATLLWSYTLISGDYLSLGISALFILPTYIAAIFFGDKKTIPLYLLLFPAFWLIFYILIVAEFLALLKSIGMLLNNQNVVWQNWNREGVVKKYEVDTNMARI